MNTTISLHAEPVVTANVDRRRREQLNEAIVLEHVSGKAWRVCDARLAAGAPERFLGFVEERNDLFEVMQITETFIWTSFESMRDALDHIVATNQHVAEQRLQESAGSAKLPTTTGCSNASTC